MSKPAGVTTEFSQTKHELHQRFKLCELRQAALNAACSLPSKHKRPQPCRSRIQVQLLLLDFKHPGLNLCTQSARYQRDAVSPCNPTLQLISRSHSLAHRETCGVMWCGVVWPHLALDPHQVLGTELGQQCHNGVEDVVRCRLGWAGLRWGGLWRGRRLLLLRWAGPPCGGVLRHAMELGDVCRSTARIMSTASCRVQL